MKGCLAQVVETVSRGGKEKLVKRRRRKGLTGVKLEAKVVADQYLRTWI